MKNLELILRSYDNETGASVLIATTMVGQEAVYNAYD
jgi:hypothetical protein